MFFCDACGSLVQRRTVRGQVVQVCPKCDAVGSGSAPKVWWKADAKASAPDRSSAAARAAASGTRAAVTTPRSRSDELGSSSRRRGGGGDRDERADPKPPQERRPPKELPPPPDVQVPKGADFFPYGTVRDGQRQFVADVAETVERGGILVANAPTGLGKTVSSLAPVVRHALEHKKRVFFLTSKQSQHKIAIDTLRAIRDKAGVPIVVSDVIGKQDMCPRREARELYPKRFAEFCRRQVVNRECEYFENANTGALRILKERPHHVEEAVIVATDCVVCPHQTALDLAAQAHVTVCDFNYFFSDMRENMQERLKVDISDVVLIVDEAHNLPDRIRDHLRLELNDFVLDDVVDEMKDLGDERVRRLVEGLREVLHTLDAEPEDEVTLDPETRAFVVSEKRGPRSGPSRDGERLVPRDDLVRRVNEHFEKGVASLVMADYESLLSDLQVVAGHYEEQFKEEPRAIGLLREFLLNWKRERQGLARVFTRDPAPTLTYAILDPSLLSRTVFEGAHAAVLMSGTLHPGEMYRDVLGLPPARTEVRYYRSPFPPENRLLLVDDSVTTSYQERSDAMSERIAANLAAVADATPGNVAAFFPSYAILESVGRYLTHLVRHKQLIIEAKGSTKAEKESLVGDMRRAPENALLCGVQGGSLSEGYDYEDNLLKGVVIVGLPFAVPSLEVQALIEYYEKKFGKGVGRSYAYAYPTMNRVLQAAGRCIRSPDDQGVIVLMDKRFNWSSYRQMYPAGFEPRHTRNLGADVSAFWSRR